MPMINNDSAQIRTREQIRESMMQALKNNDAAGYAAAFDEMMQRVGEDLRQEYEQRFDELQARSDAAVMQLRGTNALTSEELKFYQKFGEAVKARDPKQAIQNGEVVMPETIITRVFEELRERHPLLSAINFIPTTYATKILVNTNGRVTAEWGELCDEITKELLAGFAAMDATLCKLSAFLPVCKAMIDLGPAWLDRFVRETLYEAFANGLEDGFVDGTGKEQPIGMNRALTGAVDGVHSKKTAVAVTEFTPASVGALVAQLAAGAGGKIRDVSGLILVANPVDYYTKVMPATTLQAPDGTYRNDVFPYPCRIIPSAAVDQGEAVFGMAPKYIGLAGSAEGGNIEYSDHYQFLEDKRVYLIKGYAYGRPADNNAFLLLDISGLQPAVWAVKPITDAAAAEDDGE